MTMRRVYSCDSVPMAWHIRNILEEHGIYSIVKNDKLYSISGEIPVSECLPEVWVRNSLYFEYAKKIIEQVESENIEDEDDWCCHSCGEQNYANFGACWNCSVAIPARE